jgi:hypothetical protein
VGIGVGIASALGGELVDVRRYSIFIAIAAEVGADVLATEPENILFLLL